MRGVLHGSSRSGVRLRLSFLILLLLAIVSSPAHAQQRGARLALVIGVADYDANGQVDGSDAALARARSQGFLGDLENTRNDAADMRDALTEIGFRVEFALNPNKSAMEAAFRNFGRLLGQAGPNAQVVIYYAGHAVQVDGENYLIPAGARLLPAQGRAELTAAVVPASMALEQFSERTAPGLNLLILDSCRNNPWQGRGEGPFAPRGMRELQAGTSRTVVAFSTQPGNVALDGGGRNSPYTGALLGWIRRPRLTVIDMLDRVGEQVGAATGLQQVPWQQGSSIRDACLVSCPPPRAVPIVNDPVRARRNAPAAATPDWQLDWESSAGDGYIYFGFDSDGLSEEMIGFLDRYAEWFARHQEFSFILVGSADRDEFGERVSDQFVQPLSARRAENVRQYLTARGIPAGRMIVESYGSSRLVETGREVASIATNRYVRVVPVPGNGW